MFRKHSEKENIKDKIFVTIAIHAYIVMNV